MAKLHIFDAHLETANRWMKELVEHLELPPDDPDRPLHALRAGLHAIRDRLPDEETIALGAQLPTILRGVYYEGWTRHRDLAQLRDRDAMIARVAAELGPDHRLDPTEVLRAVIHLLVVHVSTGQIEHVLATLPKSIAALWRDFTDLAIEAPSRPAHGTRRTGYAR
jgi:uncharacterized protein (DUF2267 family)